MSQIDLNKALFKTLLNDYEKYKKEKKHQAQFQTGIDFIEAVIKFFGVLNISLIKELNEDIYKKIISQNFKPQPSLGDYKSLATHPFLDEYKDNLINDEFYDFLYKTFNTSTNLSGQLLAIKAFIEDIDQKATKSTQNISKLKDLFDNYLVTFRNKLKGHAASFKEEETLQVKNILDTSNKIIKTLKKVINNILKEINFYEKDSIICAKYKNEEIELLPLMIYHDCNKYSCKEKHRVKIFFFNDKNKENIYFLDYGYNHFYNLKEDENLKEKLNKFFDKLKEYQKEMKVFSYINAEDRKNKLLENFVGREEELKNIKAHIQNNQATFTYIIGKPGIGKSAFVSKLLDEIDEKEYNKFLYYAKRGNEGKDKESQLKNIYSRLNTLIIESLGIKKEDDKEGNLTLNHKFENLFKLYQEKASKPLIITIDGLDEYEDWEYIISNIPITFSNKIHLIVTSRDYNDMVDYIIAKVADYNSSVKVFTTQNSKKRNYYLELGKLSNEEVAELISIAIPKEIKDSENYKEIIDIIIKKSEALPLYFDYLIQKLKDENIKLNEFKEWSEKLPEGIDEFYEKSFKEAKDALNILKLIYFSTGLIYFRDMRTIFENLKLAQNVDFEKEFNKIEIFLEETKGKYGFYHQSVKDALEIFLENKEELFVLDNKKLEELLYFNPQKIVYLDKESQTFKLLEETINFLKVKQSLPFYQTDFFHLYYQYIHFRMYQEMLTFDDVKQKNYENILKHTQIDDEIKELIKDFFERFDKKEEKYLYEIRYAYNLAFLIEDYERVLKYMDEYQNYIYDLFLDIALNIDKVEYVQKFIELKDDWINNIPKELKDFYVEVMAKKEKLPNEFVEGMEKLNIKFLRTYNYINEESLTKIFKDFNHLKDNSIEEIINKTKNEKNSYINSRIFLYLYKKTKNKKFIFQAMKYALQTSSYERVIILKEIANNTNNVDILIQIIDNMPIQDEKLNIIYKKTKNLSKKNLHSFLKIITNNVIYDYKKANLFYKFINEEKFFKKINIKNLICEINKISDDYLKTILLKELIQKIDIKDINILKTLLKKLSINDAYYIYIILYLILDLIYKHIKVDIKSLFTSYELLQNIDKTILIRLLKKNKYEILLYRIFCIIQQNKDVYSMKYIVLNFTPNQEIDLNYNIPGNVNNIIFNNKISLNLFIKYNFYKNLIIQQKINISDTLNILSILPNCENHILRYFGIVKEEDNKDNILDGVDKTKLEIAKNLLDKLDDETISQTTRLDIKVIKYLREKGAK